MSLARRIPGCSLILFIVLFLFVGFLLLIIFLLGICEFDKENTRLFFDMVDRRYQKEGYSNMVFTSNRDPAQWKENFCENDALLCALDRIFDDAVVFTIKGESFRGRKLETVALRTSTGSPADPQQAG